MANFKVLTPTEVGELNGTALAQYEKDLAAFEAAQEDTSGYTNEEYSMYTNVTVVSIGKDIKTFESAGAAEYRSVSVKDATGKTHSAIALEQHLDRIEVGGSFMMQMSAYDADGVQLDISQGDNLDLIDKIYNRLAPFAGGAATSADDLRALIAGNANFTRKAKTVAATTVGEED